MEEYTPDFTINVQGVKGSCPAGEKDAKEQLAAKTIPVLTCEGKVIHIDALPLYKKYNDVFLMDDVPEAERKAVAREVADRIISNLRHAGHIPAPA